MLPALHALHASLSTFLAAWADGQLAADLGTKLTCGEAEALAGLLRTAGDPCAADTWITAHAEGDDCGDEHCTCTDCASHTA